MTPLRVALFITCFNDTLFPQTGRAVVTLLERLGCEVDFPEAQTCCGQMHTRDPVSSASQWPSRRGGGADDVHLGTVGGRGHRARPR